MFPFFWWQCRRIASIMKLTALDCIWSWSNSKLTNGGVSKIWVRKRPYVFFLNLEGEHTYFWTVNCWPKKDPYFWNTPKYICVLYICTDMFFSLHPSAPNVWNLRSQRVRSPRCLGCSVPFIHVHGKWGLHKYMYLDHKDINLIINICILIAVAKCLGLSGS